MRERSRGRGRERTAQDAGVPHLVFEVGGALCVLPLLEVLEIVGIRELQRPPQAPPLLCGLLTLRGARVPVVDLAAALGGAAAPSTLESCALVVDQPGTRGSVLALAVDAVTDVRPLTPAQIAPPPRLGVLPDLAVVLGMARVDEVFLPLLSLPRVLEAAPVRSAVEAGRAAA